MEVLILGVYLEIFFFRIMWSKIRVRIIHGRALYTGKYGIQLDPKFLSSTPIIVPHLSLSSLSSFFLSGAGYI